MAAAVATAVVSVEVLAAASVEVLAVVLAEVAAEATTPAAVGVSA